MIQLKIHIQCLVFILTTYGMINPAIAQEGRLLREHARRDLNASDLLELLALTEPEFKQRFAGTPVLRAKRRGLLRNVCVALGNTGDASALPALRCAAEDAVTAPLHAVVEV